MRNTVRTPTTARFWLDRPETTKPGARSHGWKPPGACSRKNRNGFASERKVGSAGWVERFAKAIAAFIVLHPEPPALWIEAFRTCRLFPAWCIEGAFDLANIVLVRPMGASDFPKLSLTPDPNHRLISSIPSRERGRWPSSLTLGRGAVDADALLTNGA